uniref:RxLR effector candidate protein n=1 Tax=Hyaloperonospora arabidopsidis (strain Emoy2) TaxID=559515 RepID=M4BQA5_HYAAE|nr:RxLR effector candidate protein [Hyaloperonospora arabidopsidis Emoy2]
MRLHAIELWAALTLVSIEGDSAATASELPAAKSRPPPPSSAYNSIDFQSEITSRKAESPAAISEERGTDRVSFAASWIRQAAEVEDTAWTTRAVDKLQLEDNISAAVLKLKSPTPLNKVLRIGNEKKPGVPLNEDSTERYALQNAVDDLVHASQSTSEKEKRIADMWWKQLCALFVRYDQPIAGVAELLNVDGLKGLTEKLEMLKYYIGVSPTSGPNTFLETMTANLGSEKDLVSFIGRAKLNDDVERRATELEGLQIAKWQAENKDPVELLNSMQMDKSMDALISPALYTVMKYIAEHNLEHPDKKFSVLTPVRERLGDTHVMGALVAARSNGQSKVTEGFANELLSEMKKLWKGEGKSKREFLAASGLLDGQERRNGIPGSASQRVTGCTVFSSTKRKFVPEGDVPMETVMYRAAEATRVEVKPCRELGLFFRGSAHPKLGDHRFICTDDMQRGQSASFARRRPFPVTYSFCATL